MDTTIALRKLKEKLISYYRTHNETAIQHIDAHLGLQRSLREYLKILDETYNTRSCRPDTSSAMTPFMLIGSSFVILNSVSTDPEWLDLVATIDKEKDLGEVRFALFCCIFHLSL